MNNERMPPHDEAAEEAVNASILMEGAADKALNLSVSDFFTPRNQLIYAAIQDLAIRGIGINQITVAQELQRQGKLTEAGGAAHISLIQANCPTSLHLEYYAGIVRQCATRRKLIEAAGKIAESAYDAPEPDAAIAGADALITSLRKARSRLEVISPKDRADMMLAEYTKRNDQTSKVATATHIPRLDYILGGGMYPGELMVIGARPGAGKTTIAQYMAGCIGDEGDPVLFCSAEMTIGGLSDREVAEKTEVPLSVIRYGKYDEKTYQKIITSMGALADRNVHYLPRGGMTVARVVQAADMTRNRAGSLKLIIVDHLGRLRPASRGMPRHIELGEMTSDLADLAKEMECPVILLCQLNREVEHRDDKRPTLNDLRESGRIEEDADIVLLMYRQGYYGPDPGNVTEINVAKLRQSDDGVRRGVRVKYERSKGFLEA